MEKMYLSAIRDCGQIVSDGDNVLIFAKNLWIFRADGSFIAKHKTIRNPYKAAFLPNNKALVDGNGDRSYHYIDLDSGEILWSSIKKGRRLRYMTEFAVTPDEKTLYDLYYDYKGICYIDRICPECGLHTKHAVSGGFCVTDDFYCDKEGVLCVLQSHLISNDCQQQRGILRLPWVEDAPAPAWECTWTAPSIPRVRGGNSQYILYNDLHVLNRTTNETFDLLENDSGPRPPQDGFAYSFDHKTGCLTVAYLICALNIVIDCNARKRVAQYFRKNKYVGFMGCLISGEFWVGTDEGVIRRPFPHIDELEE